MWSKRSSCSPLLENETMLLQFSIRAGIYNSTSLAIFNNLSVHVVSEKMPQWNDALPECQLNLTKQKPSNDSGLVLIQTSLLFLCKPSSSNAN